MCTHIQKNTGISINTSISINWIVNMPKVKHLFEKIDLTCTDNTVRPQYTCRPIRVKNYAAVVLKNV